LVRIKRQTLNTKFNYFSGVVRSLKRETEGALVSSKTQHGVLNVFKKSAVLLSSAALLVAAVTLTSTSSAIAKTKKTTHRIASAGRGAYFVPPPPPYQPSILPEMQYSHATASNVQQIAEKPPENPYKKYIYTRNPADTPTPVQQNKYVSYWSK